MSDRCESKPTRLTSFRLVGLLLAKPNWLPVLAVFVVWKGGRRALAGLAATLSMIERIVESEQFDLGADPVLSPIVALPPQ